MSELMTYVPVLMTVILILTVLTGFIVQVIKGAFYDKIPTNLLACIVAFIVTILAAVAFWSFFQFAITGWMIVALVFLCFLVAFSAMYGYDKLMQGFQQAGFIKERKGTNAN